MSEIVQNQYSSWQAENSAKFIYNGFIYVGQVDTDPLIEANQVRVYYIDEQTGQEVDLAQPIRTNSSGFPVISETNSTVKQIRTDSDYSVKVLNRKGAQEWYIPKASSLSPVIAIEHNETLNRNAPNAHESSAISLTQGGTVQDAINYVTPLTFGATPVNGVPVDSTDELNLAFASAASGVKLVIDKPFYHTGPLQCISSGRIDIEFRGEGEIITDENFSYPWALWVSHLPNVTDVSVYWDSTQRSGGQQLTNNATDNQDFIDVADTSNFVIGRYVYIASTDQWVTSRAQYIKGEYRRISGKTSTRIFIDGVLEDSYTASTTKAFPSSPPKVSIKNLKMTGPDNQNSIRGLRLWECRNASIENPEATGYNDHGVDLTMLAGGLITNADVDDSDKPYSTPSRTSYSLGLNSCTDVSVVGGTFRGGRHSFAMSGYIPNTNINISGASVYSSDENDNNVAAFDCHENSRNISINQVKVYGGLNVASHDLDMNDVEVILTQETLRVCEIRVYRPCDYIKANNITIRGEDCIGGLVIRPVLPNINIKKVEQNNNVVNVSLADNITRMGLGVEPNTGATGCSIDLLEQTDNVVEIDTNTGATCMGCYDITDFDTRIRIANIVLQGNRNVNKGDGSCYDYYVSDDSTTSLIINGERSTALGDGRCFGFRGMDTIEWQHNDISMSSEALANNRFNLFRDTRKVNLIGGKISRSYYNGYRLIDVTEHNAINVERSNCVINPSDFSRINAPFIAHSVATVASDGSNLYTYNCSVTRASAGVYRVTFETRQENSTDYPVIVTPSPTSVSRINFNSVDITFDADTDFSFISF